MKKIIIGLLSIALCLTLSHKHVYAENNTVPILQIPVISDIHIQDQPQKDRLRKALNDYKTIAPYYSTIAFVGDITNHGYPSEYDDFMNIINNNVPQNVEKVIAMGNHEYREVWYKGIVQSDIYINRFKEKTKMPNVYYDKWISRYHFITLGADNLNYNIANDGRISDEEYSWLESTLAVGADVNKPIFVFLHQPIPDTVYGSQYWGGNLTDRKLFNILKKYPQVILFSGHSHNLLDHPRTVYQDGFTMVNTSSVAYTLYDGGQGPEEYSQGLLVNVYNDRVEIKAREFSTGTYIKTFLIKTPYEKTFYDNEKPVFSANTIINVNNITNTSADLSLSAASDNSQVDAYVIKNNNQILKTVYIKYWENSNGLIETLLTDLMPGTQYNLEVYAIDSWMNESLLPISVKFTTSNKYGWVSSGDTWSYYDMKGNKVTGWVLYKNMWYYLDGSGAMLTGWIWYNNSWYYMDSSGAMKTGWVLYNGYWYYLKSDGSMATGWINDSGRWYLLNSNGIWIN